MTRHSLARLLGGAIILSASLSPGIDVAGADPTKAAQSEVVSTSNAPRGAGAARDRVMEIFLTGYSYWDNTPPGTAAIAKPVLRREAGGTGSYQDPITIAVGHTLAGGRQTLDFPAGTRFYLPRLRKYAIVEDVCGDGPTPQNGPCHTGHKGLPWLDIYVGGGHDNKQASDSCMTRLTGVQATIMNPSPHYPVVAGELTSSGCPVY